MGKIDNPKIACVKNCWWCNKSTRTCIPEPCGCLMINSRWIKISFVETPAQSWTNVLHQMKDSEPYKRSQKLWQRRLHVLIFVHIKTHSITHTFKSQSTNKQTVMHFRSEHWHIQEHLHINYSHTNTRIPRKKHFCVTYEQELEEKSIWRYSYEYTQKCHCNRNSSYSRFPDTQSTKHF